MCDLMEEPDTMDLPFFFCGKNEHGKSQTCDMQTILGGHWPPRTPTQWLHYTPPGKSPRKYVVHSIGEAVMANRTRNEPHPSTYDITEALAGAMHPTAEAHAAAADEVVKELMRAR